MMFICSRIFLFPLGGAALSTVPSALLEKRHAASQSAEDDEFRKFCASLIYQPSNPPSKYPVEVTVGAKKRTKLTFNLSFQPLRDLVELSLALVDGVRWVGRSVAIHLREKVRSEKARVGRTS